MKQTKLWMRTVILALCALWSSAMLAQSGDGVEIIHECDTTTGFYIQNGHKFITK